MKVKAGEFARMSRVQQMELIRSEIEKSVRILEQNWNMLNVLKKTAPYDMSLMPLEQNVAYAKRLERKEMFLKKKIAAMRWNAMTA